MSEDDHFDLWEGESSEGQRAGLEGCEIEQNESAPPKYKKNRENHREVEKRRRDRMKTYFTDLEKVMVSLNVLSAIRPNKLDLLCTAKMCLKSLGSPGCRQPDESYKPSFLTDEELKNLISEGAGGFLFMVTCDTGHVVYVTDTISRVLNRSEQEWLGTTIYDQVHAADVGKVREQLSIHEVPGSMLDLKSGTLKKEGCQASTRYWNCRRNFVCRMKVGGNSDCIVSTPIKPINRLGDKDYVVAHCTGYVRNWVGNEIGGIKNYYLIAMGRVEVIPSSSSCNCKEIPIHPTDTSDPFKNNEFVLKLLPDEKVVFADERITSVLGFASQELLNKSCFDFFHVDDYLTVKDGFHQAVKLNGQEVRFVCRFKSKNSGWIWTKIVVVAFTNPFSNELEFLICTCSNAKSMEIPSRINMNLPLPNLNNSTNILNTLQTSNFLNDIQRYDNTLNHLSAPESLVDFNASLIENNASILDDFNAISNFN